MVRQGSPISSYTHGKLMKGNIIKKADFSKSISKRRDILDRSELSVFSVSVYMFTVMDLAVLDVTVFWTWS